jgi:60 kDa SS-A/Ro ribonucleoprotein
MTRYAEHVNVRKTAQTEPARADQVQNSAGGYVFAVSKWTRLDRFLTLGAEGGTYYVDEKKLTVDNAKCVRECLAEDGLRTVARIVAISDAGRAPKNDPAIFALAMAAGDPDPKTRAAALAALPAVCRIGTHLFHFVNDVGNFRGWGPSLEKAVARWYNDRSPDALALQAIKYQQRDGWAHKDVLRLAHPVPRSPAHNAIYRWMCGEALPNAKRVRAHHAIGELPAIMEAFKAIHAPDVDVKSAIKLICEHRLPHECVPNELKGRPEIWEALLPHMGQTALLRNLAKMTSTGLLAPMSKATQSVVSTLTDTSKLFAGRIHPISVLLALKTYASGHGVKGSLTWAPVREVVDALDEAFYLSFQAIEPSGKRTLLGLDVSGSMDAKIGGTNLSCREAAAAMAMATARTEKHWHAMGFGNTFVPLAISPKQRLDDVVRTIDNLPFQRTDCALPMLYAAAGKIPVDTFCVYTDNETYYGNIHPFQALRQYRDKMGIDAKLVVCGMTATNFSIADPSDAAMLDVAGFDAAVPAVIADFSSAREVIA